MTAIPAGAGLKLIDEGGRLLLGHLGERLRTEVIEQVLMCFVLHESLRSEEPEQEPALALRHRDEH